MSEEITFVKTQINWWRTWGWIRGPRTRREQLRQLKLCLGLLEICEAQMRTRNKLNDPVVRRGTVERRV